MDPSMLISAGKIAQWETKPVIKSKSMYSHWCYTTKQEKKAAVYCMLEPIHLLNRAYNLLHFTRGSVAAQNEPVFELFVF